jgi:glycosyltransferase involved in cell wall biosynthesis
MIVRNEAAAVGRCLLSVEALVDEVIIVDTGSDDRTIELCRGHGAMVHGLPWQDDFSAARNFGLEKAGGDWILVLDADDELAAGDRPKVRGLIGGRGVDAYIFRTLSYLGDEPGEGAVVCPHVRLFRNRAGLRYVGRTHERLDLPAGTRLAYRDITVLHYGYLRPVVRRQDKVRRNLRICQAVVQADPGDAFAHFNLGTEYIRAGHYLKGLASLRQAHRLGGVDPGWAPELARKLSLYLIRLGRHREADALLTRSLEAYPDYTDLVFLRATLHQETRDYAQAAGEFSRCLRMGEAPPEYTSDLGVGTFKAAFGLGHAHRAMGNHLRAAAAYRLVLKLNPSSELALPFLIEALAEAKDPDRALEDLKRLLASTPPVLLALARAFADNGFYRQALDCLADIKGAQPHDGHPGAARAPARPSIALLRGLCLLGLRQPEAAGVALLEVRSDSPDYPQAAVGLCLCAWVLNRPAQAAGLLTRLGQLERREPGSLVGGRGGLAALRRFNRMLLDRGRSAARRREKPPPGQKQPAPAGHRREALLNLAEKLIELGRPDQARLAFRLVSPGGRDLEAATRVGRSLLRYGYVALAREQLNRVGGRRKPSGKGRLDFLRVLATVELKTGHLSRAARLYRLILTVDPRDLGAYSGLAEALESQSKRLIGPVGPVAYGDKAPGNEGRDQGWKDRLV